jgi:hypothetical protein
VYCLPVPPLQKRACLLRKSFEGRFFIWYANIHLFVIKFDGLAARFARRQAFKILSYFFVLTQKSSKKSQA